MAVGNRHAEALCRDGRGGRVDNLIALNVAPQLHRLLLGFFFLAADIRDDVVENIGIRFKGFAGAGDGLIRAGEHLRDAEVHQWVNSRNVALKGAVGFYGDKAALCAEALSLCVDDFNVVGVDLRHNHRHILDATVCAVVGDDRALLFRISFFKGADFVFFHIDGAEYKIDLGDDFVHICNSV